MAIQASARPQSVRFGSSAPLPVHLTALVGRTEEIGEVTALLGISRLVSLVGAGGSGKSRLAAAVAAGLQSRYRDAVGWIDLGALTNPADVDAQVAATLGLREQADGTSLDAVIALIGLATAAGSRVSSSPLTRSSRRRSRSSATPSSSAGWIFRARFCTPSRTIGGARSRSPMAIPL